MDSILTSVKKLLGIEPDYTHFDQDIIIQINTVLSGLRQMGVGPEDGFSIVDESTTWYELLGGNKLEDVKTYVYLKVKLIFDPPTNSSFKESIESTLNELVYRISTTIEDEV